MNPDKFQQAWQTQSSQTRVTFDADLLSNEVQRSQQEFRSIIFWRDVREAGTSLVLIPIWFVMGYAMSLPWTWYLTVPALIWVAGFILVDRRLHPQQPSAPGEPLLFYVKESLTQVEHQIWLLRNVFWWYLLPFCVSIMVFFLHVAWNSSGSWWGTLLLGGFGGLFLYVIYGAVYRLNQSAVRTQLEPRRQELLKLVASLEDETTNQDSEEIVDLVSALNDPLSDCGLYSSWADNWNLLVPSWRVAAAIILPTLIGGLCGLWSGLWLQIHEMGPVFFQAVVGAVIPFEIALVFVWRWSRKQEKPYAPTDEKPRRLPRAPAVAILVLTLFLGLMAVLAVISFMIFAGADVPFIAANELHEPAFDDVSAFDDLAILRVDLWLQQQVGRADYPSLCVAVVRDGEIVYQRAFGFENIQAERKASPQTQYYVASVTKAFTATLAGLLHERGVIDLDEPVVRYLPDDITISTTPDLGASITMRQLASHTSGLPRGVPGRVQSVEGWYQLEPQRLYDHLADVSLEYDPGTGEGYSNLGFGLLGHALECAADKPFDQLLQELICEPLQLEKTAIPINDSLKPATGYSSSDWRIEQSHSFRERLAPSGGLVTSVEDLAEFLAAHMQPGVFSNELLQQLHTEPTQADGSKASRALGWSVRTSDYVGRILQKNGGRNNCNAWIGFAPEHGVGVAVVTNCGDPDVDQIGYWLLERAVPGAHQPVTKYGYAKVAPYTGVRWENGIPVVRVNDKWSPLVSINGIPIERILEFANDEFGEKAHKRFAEDLVELLSKMGHEPEWNVTLGLETQEGGVEHLEVEMTEQNRALVRE